ncbi:hypothetical protein ACFLUU_10855 [Chloroflexota bacterium]
MMSVSIEILEKARRKEAIIREVPISCYYVSITLNLKAIMHGLSVALSVVRIRLKNSLRSFVGDDCPVYEVVDRYAVR